MVGIVGTSDLCPIYSAQFLFEKNYIMTQNSWPVVNLINVLSVFPLESFAFDCT
jgi:hypothetical protein